MLRRVGVLAASVVAVLAGTAVPPASATDTATCDGRPATIVQTGGDVTGTDGDDVIVATDALQVDALAGDDVVCATNVLDTYLGAGDDTYLGNADRRDAVLDDADAAGDVSVGHDVVTTSAPNTNVFSVGTAADPDTDQVSGTHLDVILSGPSTGAYASGKPGYLAYSYDGPRVPIRFDLPDDELTTGSTTASISDFRTFDLRGVRRWSGLTFLGSPAVETLDAVQTPGVTYDRRGPFDVRLGGGDDQADLPVSARGVVRGGSGDDVVKVSAGHHARTVSADLLTGRISADGATPVHVSGVEDLRLTGWRAADVTGSDGPDDIGVSACRGRVDALAGDDVVRVLDAHDCFPRRDGPLGFRVLLGRGDDTAQGSPFPDVLIGGRGHDEVTGGGGRDSCVAEVEHGC